jgi:hypothetical protein
VQLNDEIAVRVEPPRHPLGKERRQLARRPAQEMAVRKTTGDKKTVESRSGVSVIEHARCRRRVDPHVRVVNHACVPRPEFDTTDIFRRTSWNRDHEIPEHVGPPCAEHVRIRQRDHEIWLTQTPAVGETRRRWKSRRIALHGALVDPSLNRIDLAIGKPVCACKIAKSGFRFPGRHRTVARGPRHGARLRPRILERQETEWCDFSRSMTGDTVLVEDRRDVFGERDRRLREGVRRQADQPDDPGEGTGAKSGPPVRTTAAHPQQNTPVRLLGVVSGQPDPNPMRRWYAPALLYVAITVAMVFPLLRHIGSVIPHDLGDPVLNTWLLWWSAKRVPLTSAWWNAPMFFPAADVMALSELLLGLLPITIVVQWLTHNPLTAHNVSFVLSFPLCGLAAYGLAWELTGRRDAALLAGLAFAFAPYRMGQLAHLQVLSYYWAPVALLGLHRYLRTRERRWLILFGVAWLMQALTNGYALFHLSVLVVLWLIWFARPRRTALPIVAAWLIAAIPLVPPLLKYRRVHAALHLVRDINEIKRYSAGLADLFAPSPELVFWGSRLLPDRPERTLFPGATMLIVGLLWLVASRTWRHASGESRTWDEKVLTALSAIAAAISVSIFIVGPWAIGPLTVGDFRKPFSLAVLFRLVAFLRSRWMRCAWGRHSIAVFYLVAMATMFLLALGPEPRFFGRPILYEAPYAWLMRLPGFDTLRVPARFAMLFVLCQSVLLAFAVSRFATRTVRSQVLVVLIGAGLLMDGWARVHVEQPPPAGLQWPEAVAAVVEMPLGGQRDFDAIYRSLRHGRPIVNGYSGYDPPFYLPFVSAIRDHQFSALREISRGQLIGIAVNRSASDAATAEALLRRMTGVSGLTSDDRWSTFVLQTGIPRDDRLGGNVSIKSIRANRHDEDTGRMTDGRIETAWSSGENQIGDEEVRVDLGTEQSIGGIIFRMGAFSFGFPRDLVIDVSSDQVDWRRAWAGRTAVQAVHAAVTDPGTVPLTIDVGEMKGRYIRLQQIGSEPGIPWWIAELHVCAPAGTTPLP